MMKYYRTVLFKFLKINTIDQLNEIKQKVKTMFKALERYRTKYIDPLLDKVPGKQRFGTYRFLPFFFIFGATVELLMIKWTVGETNFCT
jgi:hypothetical protein